MSDQVEPNRTYVTALFALVFLFMLGDSLQQTILPISIEQTTTASLTLIGLMIALPQGVGFLSALPCCAWGDAHGGRTPVVVAAGLGAVSVLAIAGLALGREPHWWVLPILLLGLTRSTVWIITLAAVSSTGDRVHMQGLNGATQRGAAAVAAVIAAVVIAHHAWTTAYVLMGVCFLLIVPLASVVLRTGKSSGLPTALESYGYAVALLRRDRAIQASGMVAVTCMTVMLIGNAFFALTVEGSPSQVAQLVLVLLLTRDAASIVFGLAFRHVMRVLAIPGTLALSTSLGVLGTSLLIIGQHPLAVGVGAILQGACISWCIGTTNLLAVLAQGPQAAGPALRISVTNIGPSAAGLLVPILLAATFDQWGESMLLMVAALVCMLFGCLAYALARSALRPAPATAENHGTAQIDYPYRQPASHDQGNSVTARLEPDQLPGRG